MLTEGVMAARSDAAGRCLPLAEWPALDRAAWEAALVPGDFLEPRGQAAHWRPRSAAKTAKGYGRWLAWLKEADLLDPASAPGHRVTKERVKAFLRDLSTMNAAFTLVSRAQELYDAVRVMSPEQDWTWLRRAMAVLRSRAVPVRDKRARLQPSGRLVALGMALMAEAEAAVMRPALTRAVLYRDGLMIALLAYRPVRLRSFAITTLGRNVIQVGPSYYLRYGATATKNKSKFEAEVPTVLLPGLERYLTHHRAVLLRRGARRPAPDLEALWVSEVATAMAERSIHGRIRKHTLAAFGKALPPHWFRDAAATSIAIDAPLHVHDIMSILGHGSLATAEQHYNQAQSLQASRRYGSVLASLCRSPTAAQSIKSRRRDSN